MPKWREPYLIKPMNTTQIKCLLVFCVFAVIGFGPISPSCLIGMYIVAHRPDWFLLTTRELYANPPPSHHLARHPFAVRLKCFLSLVTLFILDIAPVPVTASVAFVIILARPRWFYDMVETIYTKT